MKQMLWLGLFFLSISWLFLVPIFTTPEWTLGLICVVLGVILNIIALRKEGPKIGNKYYFLLCIPLLISLYFLEFPYTIGVIVLLIGMFVFGLSLLRSSFQKVQTLSPGLFLSGILLLFQAFIIPLYVKVASRYHGSDLFTSLIATIGNLFGLDMTNNGDTLYLGAIDSNPAIVLSWESLGLYPWIFLLVGALVLFLFSKSKKQVGTSLLVFIGISLIYMLLRFLALLFVLVETMETEELTFLVGVMDVFYDPLIQLFIIIPFILLMIRFIPLHETKTSFQWMAHAHLNRQLLVALILIFVCAFSAVASVGFQDPGRQKGGKVLIDELHSDWEDTVRPLDTEWYGRLSTYNFYSWADWLMHYYDIDQNLNDTLTADFLSSYDIVILKCPTSAYSDEEEAALVDYVEQGGGLYAIGDHTNVFGMNSYLNKITRNFGIEFNTDATHEYSAPGGFSVFVPSTLLPHPIVQFVSDFQFLTSDTLDAPLTAEEVIAGDKLTTFPGTYSTAAFFVEDKMWEQTRGVFLQTVAVKYGKGRVVAFSDSTVFSSYSMFLSGYKPFNLGAMEYLNRENAYSYLNIVFFIGALICFGVSIYLLRGEQKIKSLMLIAIVGVASVSIAAVSITALNKTLYPLPEVQEEFSKVVCFDNEHSGAIISPVPSFAWGDNLNRDQKQRYLTFFVWTQRVGCTPSLEQTLEDALHKGDCVVILNPDTSFDIQERSSLSDYILEGGIVLLMDSIYNFDSTANELLSQFSMSLTTFNDPLSANMSDKKIHNLFNKTQSLSVGDSIQPVLTINGGTTLLQAENDQVQCAFKSWGKGVLAVFVDAASFSDEQMGGVFTEPNSNLRRIYDTEYYLFENLLLQEEDVEAAHLTGYVYIDANNNNQYDANDEVSLSNVTVSLEKIDDIYKEVEVDLVTSEEAKTTSEGIYNLSDMMPGYYHFEASLDDIIIAEGTLYLSSGTTTQYNISQVDFCSLEGITFYDTNRNGTYDLGEERGNITINLSYIYDGGEHKVIASTHSDENGAYSFSSLIPGYYLLNTTQINSTSGFLNYEGETGVTLFEGTSLTRNISLLLKGVNVNGTLLYNNTAKANIYLYFFRNNSIKNNSATSFTSAYANTSGIYKAFLIPGFYNLTINQTVFEEGESVRYFLTKSIEITKGEGAKVLDLYLKKEESSS